MSATTELRTAHDTSLAEQTILKAVGLVKIFKNNRGVKDVSFEVSAGEIVVLMGPNGAGKTTSFRMTCGLIEPDAGRVFLNGHDVTNWPMYRRAREGGMGYLAQEQSIFRELTVEKNLLGVMELLGYDREQRRRRCDHLLEQFDMAKLRKSKARTLSGGEKRRLEIARALVSDPDIILLDEPFTGIDPITIDDIQEIIRGLRDSGFSILITDHQVRETLQIADRCYIIRDGHVLCHGKPQEVVMNEEARRHYFGDDPELGKAFAPAPHQAAAPVGRSRERSPSSERDAPREGSGKDAPHGLSGQYGSGSRRRIDL